MPIRLLLLFISLVIGMGCTHAPVAVHNPTAVPDLKGLIGQKVTLRGQFEMAGKEGPLIVLHDQSIYLIPHGAFRWSAEYGRMQGKSVKVTGTLHFQKFPHDMSQNGWLQVPPDYYYMDAENAQVSLD